MGWQRNKLKFTVASAPRVRVQQKAFLKLAQGRQGCDHVERQFCFSSSLHGKACQVSSLVWPLAHTWEHVLLVTKFHVQVSLTSPLQAGEAMDQIAPMAASGIDRTLTSKGTLLSPQLPQSSNIPLSTETHLEYFILWHSLSYIWLLAVCCNMFFVGRHTGH